MSAESQSRGTTTVEQAIRAQRQQIALKITLYANGRPHNDQEDDHLRQPSLSGMGTSTSRWGTSAYSFSGDLAGHMEACRIRCLSLDLCGKRVSGFDCGDVRFTIRRPVQVRWLVSGLRWIAPRLTATTTTAILPSEST